MKDTADWLKTCDDYLILTHARPDGDTVGCAVALCTGLRVIGKNAFVAQNPDFTDRQSPFVSTLLAPKDYVYRTVITVDTARVSLMPKIFRDMHVDLKIDHHPSGEVFSDRELVMPEKAACGEIVAGVLDVMGVPFTQDIALGIYLAISTDTGCFQYLNTTADTMRLAARCLDSGIDRMRVLQPFFLVKTRSRLDIEAQVLSTIEYYGGGSLAVAILTRDMIENAGADEDDLENLSAIPKYIIGVSVGVLIREEKDGCRLSVRTSPPYRADRICAELGGGGHMLAGGAYTGLSVSEAEAKLLDVWKKINA